jgi:hypothetical protein
MSGQQVSQSRFAYLRRPIRWAIAATALTLAFFGILSDILVNTELRVFISLASVSGSAMVLGALTMFFEQRRILPAIALGVAGAVLLVPALLGTLIMFIGFAPPTR